MNLSRRGFLKAAAVVAPAIILTPGLLMPVRKIWTPEEVLFVQSGTGATLTLQEAMIRGYWVKVSVSAESTSPVWIGYPPEQIYVHPGGSVVVPAEARYVDVES